MQSLLLLQADSAEQLAAVPPPSGATQVTHALPSEEGVATLAAFFSPDSRRLLVLNARVSSLP